MLGLGTLRRVAGELRRDVAAAHARDPAARGVSSLEILAAWPGVQALLAHRVAHALREQRMPVAPRMLALFSRSFTNIEIHPCAEIGDGLFIDHGTGVVIGETTDIGNDVKIYQGVTLGALSVHRTRTPGRTGRGYKRHPTIGDDVTIYSGAKILGGHTVIGAGSIIGGNAWIVESVPPNSRIFGGQPLPQPMEVEPIASARREVASFERTSDGG
jgi:serine O-acetyltransferase